MLKLQHTEKVQEFKNRSYQNPLASVCVHTYNHEKSIKECLDSILCQKTDFEFEILIGEDCSSDQTRSICIQYATLYPEKIRLFLHDRSNNIEIDGKPTGRYNFIYNINSCRGKYIALCDGDDFWTCDKKLQMQVDFLQKNESYSLTHHAVKELYFPGNTYKNVLKQQYQLSEQTTELIRFNYIHTVSVVFKKDRLVLPKWHLKIRQGDWPLWILLSQVGKIKYFEKVMACYRVHKGGIWSSMDINESIQATEISILKLDKFLKYQYTKEFQEHIINLKYRALFKLHKTRKFKAFFTYFVQALKHTKLSQEYNYIDLLNHLKIFIKYQLNVWNFRSNRNK